MKNSLFLQLHQDFSGNYGYISDIVDRHKDDSEEQVDYQNDLKCLSYVEGGIEGGLVAIGIHKKVKIADK